MFLKFFGYEHFQTRFGVFFVDIIFFNTLNGIPLDIFIE